MSSRARTLQALVRSVASVVIFLMVVLVILAQFGINITPILTGAGLIGLAISLGAQSLVKDFIAGFFIIVEDQYNIGDKVKIGENKGEVYKLTLRLTVLKDKDGNLINIPNSTITTVTAFKKS